MQLPETLLSPSTRCSTRPITLVFITCSLLRVSAINTRKNLPSTASLIESARSSICLTSERNKIYTLPHHPFAPGSSPNVKWRILLMTKLYARLAVTVFLLLSVVSLGGAQSQWNEI